jgi:hypothetical protein
MTATVFSSPEPDVVITPPGAPLMPMANPAIIRSAQGRRRPAWMTAAPIAAVAALAIGGLLVATHHKAPAARQVAEVAPTALAPAVPAPTLAAAPAPVAPVAAAPITRLAARSPIYAPIRHSVARARTIAPSAPASATDASATAPIVAQTPATPVMPIAPIVAAPTPPAAPAADPMAPAAQAPVTPAPDTPKVTAPQS